MKKKGNFNTVKEVVLFNTGMSEAELLQDTREYHIKGIKEAAQVLRDYINKKIYIVGDYDVDGVSASVILKMLLDKLGAADVTVRLPRRFTEGYGMKPVMVDEFAPGSLVITVDNGIAALDAVKKAKEKGLKVIVTDHHLPVRDKNGEVTLPEADIVIDPKAIPGSADFDGYCGAGIAYKIAEEMLNDPIFLRKLCGIAAIATIADCVPLVMENRRIVKDGLRALSYTQTTTEGIARLLDEMELDQITDTEQIQFQIAPALNAPGRLYDDGARKSFRLLSFEGSHKEASILAAELVSDNDKRKRLTNEGMLKADAAAASSNLRPLVVPVEDMCPGISGIVAAKLVEKYKVPCFVLVEYDGAYHGSGRSYGGINLKELLDDAADTLIAYGGHAEAAGVTLSPDKLESFREALSDAMKSREIKEPEDYYDLEIVPEDIENTIRELGKYEPYGEGNPMPVFYVKGMHLVPRGSSHFKVLSTGTGIRLFGWNVEITAFGSAENNMADRYISMGSPRNVDLVGTLSLNCWKGKISNGMKAKFIMPTTGEQPAEPKGRRSSLAAMMARRARERGGVAETRLQ